MSGHNKWSQIKNKKAASDAKKSQQFAMLVRNVALEARRTDGNRQAPGLRAAIEQARTANMPNENIDRAIEKALGTNGENYEEVIYETYGPGGVAMIIGGLTGNKNRTGQEIKHLLSDFGLTLAAPGAVTWAFVSRDGRWQAKTETEITPAEH
mgnify:FL=1